MNHSNLTGLAMHCVMTAPLAVLLKLHTIRMGLLVLFGRVVAALAFGAGQSDQSTHEYSFMPIVLDSSCSYT